MRITGFQRFSMIDYNDKLCAVIFTQGCNLRCPYCHNPKLVSMISSDALISEAEILEFLEARVGKLDAVVITGGEPLLQQGLLPFLAEIKNLGYLIKLDTNGLLTATLATVIESGLIDYIAMDIKTELYNYEAVTKVKVPEAILLESIKLIKDSGIEHEFRTTVVEGLVSEENIINIGKNLVEKSPYYIQNFVKSQHLDKAFEDRLGFSDVKLARVAKELQNLDINIELR